MCNNSVPSKNLQRLKVTVDPPKLLYSFVHVTNQPSNNVNVPYPKRKSTMKNLPKQSVLYLVLMKSVVGLCRL